MYTPTLLLFLACSLATHTFSYLVIPSTTHKLSTLDCPEGSAPFDDICLYCSAGTFSSTGEYCHSCTNNTFSGVGAAACTPCPSGFVSDAGAAACKPHEKHLACFSEKSNGCITFNVAAGTGCAWMCQYCANNLGTNNYYFTDGVCTYQYGGCAGNPIAGKEYTCCSA